MKSNIESLRASIQMDLAGKAMAQADGNIRDMLLGHLAEAASRFRDLADIIDKSGPYADAGFLRASADRCQAAVEVATSSDN